MAISELSGAAQRPVVDTSSGPVRGLDDGAVRVFRGIRYAAPPTGALRWRAPQPPEPWTEPVDALAFGAAAPQPVNPLIDLGPGTRLDEDCLFLNVTTPTGQPPAGGWPVMVWIHGGAYSLGSTSQPVYDGHALIKASAAVGGVVLITINYRLGPLGFLDLTSLNRHLPAGATTFESNPALRDVLLALRWVQDEVAAFGGDPGSVTVFGESAGGGLVTTLLTMPAAAGLFHRAIAESSPATSMYGAQRAATVTELFLSGLGLRPEQAERLRDVPADRLTAAGTTLVSAVPARTPGVLAFAPVIDGDVLPEHPVDVFAAGRALPLPLLIGTNKDEASGFARMKSPIMPVEPDTIAAMLAAVAADQPEVLMPDEARIQAAYRDLKQSKVGLGIARDIGFRMPTVWVAQGQQQVADTYLYRFDHAPPFLELIGIGASHATELPYVFGNLQSRGPKDLTFRLGGLRAARRLSVRMQRRWLSFAVTGVPTGVDGPAWPAYTDDRRATMVFDRRERVVDDLDAPLRQAWGDAVLSYR